MRVLKASSIAASEGLSFVDLNPHDAEPYAILSHTWGKGEVLFEHVMSGTSASMPAYPKVVYACQQALDDGYEYVWIDTCCIEKNSSAELSEAINSMFVWYRDSSVCYAYLPDYGDGNNSFEESRWFTRGFTLQELIAPSNVVFYGAGWVLIGTKRSLRSVISRVTRVGETILSGERLIETASIANRMGWASDRVTSRTEDVAYCLMGIFDVNMPLLYGEGTKAFVRLQEEILKKTTDHTLFAWVDKEAPDDKQYGLLAPSPRCFADTHTLVPYELRGRRSPFTITNEGLSIDLRIRSLNDSNTAFGALLDCPTPDFEEECWFLIHIQYEKFHDRYARVQASQFGKVRDPSLPSKEEYRQILVHPEPRGRSVETDKTYFTHLLSFRYGPPSCVYRVVDAAHYPSGRKVKPFQAEEWGLGSGYHPNWTRVLVRRVTGRLTAALLFESARDARRILVSFGTYDQVRLGFQAVEIESGNKDAAEIPSGSVMQAAFIPRPVGETIELPHHMVRVESESHIQDMAKIYNVTIEIWSHESPALQAKHVSPEVTKVISPKAKELKRSSSRTKEKSTSEGVLDRLFSSISEGLHSK